MSPQRMLCLTQRECEVHSADGKVEDYQYHTAEQNLSCGFPLPQMK